MAGWPEMWIDLSAVAALVGLIAYAVLGGADFGGGVWDLFASGPRKRPQRLAIAHAMGPVWEANHVWLIFVIVILFTCFPLAYSVLSTALFVPFHLALVGIMLRGASFVFRSYQSREEAAIAEASWWGAVFGAASLITPFLLGASFGMLTKGGIRVAIGPPLEVQSATLVWLSPYCIANGLLAVATCAFLAAVYLTNETTGELRDDFRRRAIIAGTVTAALAALVLPLAWLEAPWFLRELLDPRALPIVLAGIVCFGGSAWSVFARRYALSRAFAIAEIVLVLVGWGWAQHPYLIHPDVQLAQAAAPTSTLKFMVLSLPAGMALLLPSLWFLLRVFKSNRLAPAKNRG